MRVSLEKFLCSPEVVKVGLTSSSAHTCARARARVGLPCINNKYDYKEDPRHCSHLYREYEVHTRIKKPAPPPAPTSPRSKPQKPKKQQQPQPQQQHPQQQRPRAVVVPAPAPPPAPPAAPLGPPPGADYAAPPSQAPPSRASQAPKPARPPNPAAALNNIYAALAGAGDDAELASAVAAAAWAQEQINSGRVGDALLRPPAAAAVTTAVPAAVPTPQPAAVPSARRPAGPRLDVDVVLAQLVAMDFDSELAQEAAHATAGDLEAAVEYCLGQTSRQELVQILNEPELLAPDAAMRQEQLSFALGALGRAQQAAFGGAGQQQEQEWQQATRAGTRAASRAAAGTAGSRGSRFGRWLDSWPDLGDETRRRLRLMQQHRIFKENEPPHHVLKFMADQEEEIWACNVLAWMADMQLRKQHRGVGAFPDNKESWLIGAIRFGRDSMKGKHQTVPMSPFPLDEPFDLHPSREVFDSWTESLGLPRELADVIFEVQKLHPCGLTRLELICFSQQGAPAEIMYDIALDLLKRLRKATKIERKFVAAAYFVSQAQRWTRKERPSPAKPIVFASQKPPPQQQPQQQFEQAKAPAPAGRQLPEPRGPSPAPALAAEAVPTEFPGGRSITSLEEYWRVLGASEDDAPPWEENRSSTASGATSPAPQGAGTALPTFVGRLDRHADDLWRWDGGLPAPSVQEQPQLWAAPPAASSAAAQWPSSHQGGAAPAEPSFFAEAASYRERPRPPGPPPQPTAALWGPPGPAPYPQGLSSQAGYGAIGGGISAQQPAPSAGLYGLPPPSGAGGWDYQQQQQYQQQQLHQPPPPPQAPPPQWGHQAQAQPPAGAGAGDDDGVNELLAMLTGQA